MKSIKDVVNNLGPATKQGTDFNACTVYSFAACFGVSYDEAYDYAARAWSRIRGKGVSTMTIMTTFGTGTYKEVLKRAVMKVATMTGYVQPSGEVIQRQMTLATFCKQYSRGTYYVLVDRHALAIVDGEVLDHTDKPKRRIKHAWKIS